MAFPDGTIAYRADVLTADAINEPWRHNGHAHSPTVDPSLCSAETRGAYVAAPPTQRPFTQQWNDVYDEAMYFLSGTAYKVLSFLVRQTVGYQRAEARVSLMEISEGRQRPDGRWDLGTGCSRRQIIEALRELLLANLITSDAEARSRTQVRAYRLTPSEEWRLDALAHTTSEKIALVRRRVGASEKTALVATGAKTALVDPATGAKTALVDAQTSAKNAPYINKELKKERERNSSCPTPDGADGGSASPTSPTTVARKKTPATSKPSLSEDSEPLRLAAYLRDRILAHSPNARDAKGALVPAKLANWARPIDLMVRRDERTSDDIRAVIDFATSDSFWQSNILSPGKLREQYDRLAAKMRAQSRPRPFTPRPEPARHPLNRPVPPLNAKPAQPG